MVLQAHHERMRTWPTPVKQSPNLAPLPRHGKTAKIRGTLGTRLVVGQRTLNPYGEVRILGPQPIVLFVELDKNPGAKCSGIGV